MYILFSVIHMLKNIYFKKITTTTKTIPIFPNSDSQCSKSRSVLLTLEKLVGWNLVFCQNKAKFCKLPMTYLSIQMNSKKKKKKRKEGKKNR